jgi:hypothetical protein
MYETGTMSKKQGEEFEAFLNDKIGTDYEVNEVDDDEVYIFIIDLELKSEYKLIREYEQAMEPPTDSPTYMVKG